MTTRLRPRVFASAVAIVLVAVSAPAGASIPARPALGNWEGVGPRGLPLSFDLARRHGRVVLSGLVVGFPVACPGQPGAIAGISHPHATYIGPGTPPPPVRFNWRPGNILIQAFPYLALDGRLLAPRRAVLSTVPVTAKKGCGWPSKLITWRLRPRHRLAVAVGTWTGTLTLPDATGIVTTEVVAGGRGVDVFKVQITCTNGNGEDFSSGPPANEFVSATGAFEGWHSDANAMWHGRFGADGVLRGTLVVRDRCGTGGQVNGTFTARHTVV